MNGLDKLYKDDEGYKRLKEACLMCEQDFLDSIKIDANKKYPTSKRFKKRMGKMIKGSNRSRYAFWESAVGKAAAIIIAVFLALGSFTVTAEALGFPVFGYIETAYEKFIALFVDRSEITEYPTTIEEVYTLTGLPEGFVETECYIGDVSVYTIWENGSAEIELSQGLLNEKITIDNEHSDNEKIIHNGMEVYYYSAFGITRVNFHNGRYQFIIYSSYHQTLDEMIILVDSLKIKTE